MALLCGLFLTLNKFLNNINMKKSIVILALFITATFTAKAQSYTNAVGVRLTSNTSSITSGFTIKHFLDEGTALEGIVGVNNGLGICGLYEKHFSIESVNNLQWFAGVGGYVAFFNKNTNLGGAGIIGLDYKFEEIPLNISLDWKPELNIISHVGFEGSGVGLSARFTF